MTKASIFYHNMIPHLKNKNNVHIVVNDSLSTITYVE